MRSCENLTTVKELSHEVAIEQHPCSNQQFCSEVSHKLVDSNLDNSSEPDGNLSFSVDENAGCVSPSHVMVTFIDGRDGMKGDCEMNNECKVCPNGTWHEIDGCKVESDGLCLEKVGSFGDYWLSNSMDGSEMPLQVNPVEGSLRILKKDENIEHKNIPTSSAKGVLEARSDVLAGMVNDSCHKILPSLCQKLSLELAPVASLPINCLKQDEQKNITGVIQEKVNELAQIDEDTCDQLLPSPDHEMLSELMFMTGSPRICVNQDDISTNTPSLLGALDVTREKSDVLARMRSHNCNQDFPSQIDLLGNCVQTSGQKDDETIDDVEGVVEEKSDVLTGINTDACNQLLPALGSELPLNSISMTVTLGNCAQEHEINGSNSVSGPTVEKNGYHSGRVEAGICNRIFSSLGGEMPLRLLDMGDLVSSGELQNDKKDGMSVRNLCTESFMDNVETERDSDTLTQVLPSNICLKDLEKLHKPDSLSNFLQENGQKDNQNVGGPHTESTTEVLEKKSDFTTDIIAETCNSKESSFENGSSRRLDASYPFKWDTVGCISSSSKVDCFRLTDDEGKHDVGVDCLSESKCPDTVLSYSRRSSRISRLSQKTQTKRKERNCRKVPKLQPSQKGIEFTFQTARKKRSSFHKRARSSSWGLLRSITQVFWQSDELASRQGSQKSLDAQCSRKRNKNQFGGSRSSSRKDNVSTRCLRLKVKLGKEVGKSLLNITVPEVVKGSSSVCALVSDCGTELHQGTGLQIPELANDIEDKLVKEGSEGESQFIKNPEKTMTSPDLNRSFTDGKPDDKDLEASAFSGMSVGDAAVDDPARSSNIMAETSQGTNQERYMDPGTSPDSEVINTVPDAQIGATHQEDLHNAILTTFEVLPGPTDVMNGKKGRKKGKRKDNHPGSGSCILEDRSPSTARLNKPKALKNCRGRPKLKIGFRSTDILSSSTCGKTSSSISINEELSIEPLPSIRETEIEVSGKALKVENIIEAEICDNPVHREFAEAHGSKDFLASTESKEGLLPTKSKGRQRRKSPKSCGLRKGSSKFSNSAKSRTGNSSKRKGSGQKSVDTSQVKVEGTCDHSAGRVECHPETGDTGKTDTCDDVSNLEIVSGGAVEQSNPSDDDAWVRCDDCHKWRRITVALAKSIEHCRWICKDNLDKAFADCSIPQEKSNEEINAELGISDPEEDAYDGHLSNKGVKKGLDGRRVPVPPKAKFKGINSNVFLHRSRKTQTIDEIMVCHCKPASDSHLGCGDECLNRMLNIECVQGTCPCGDLCSNQQFQRRKYPKMDWFPCGKKGYGLKMLEDVHQGQFLIEYVGEVLDMQTYEARQKKYAAKGQTHFYFMTLNGSEVIDAGVKGNLGRFINHSCQPNSRTEKWMVNGEICIGVFALRDIKKGEEVTFDYNYVRVFGAAAKKCYCGSSLCRGYIGGDPLNAEVIVQGDSDEEYPEPLMIKDDETEVGIEKTSRNSCLDHAELQVADMRAKDSETTNNSAVTVQQLECITEVEDSIDQSASAISQLQSSMEMDDSERKYFHSIDQSFLQPGEVSLRTEDVTSKPKAAFQEDISMEEAWNKSLCDIQRLETSSFSMMLDKLSSDGADANEKAKYNAIEEKQVLPKSRALVKTSRSSGSVKKGKGINNPPAGNKVQIKIANKSKVPFFKPKKLTEGSSGRIEAVEEKLNELLDADGGISKRKDTPKGYLKLLLLTAASGDGGSSEAIQSNRDLSMILDALLKTKSRVVLTDIINKNGLRMLHNIMKQYRRDFKKIPILRKLLKVLEYLAVRQILTLEHINGGPPCPGMESFRESMLSLTEHDDKQVHQIARNFRDRWIPRPLRKLTYAERDEGRMEHHRGSNCVGESVLQNQWHDQGVRPTEAIDCLMQSKVTTSVNASVQGDQSGPCISTCQSSGTKIRKRKSRWDQPTKTDSDSRSLQNKEQKIEPRLIQQCQSSPLAVSGEARLAHADKVSGEENDSPSCHQSCCQQDLAIIADVGMQETQEDVPPGFSSPLNPPLVSSNDFSSLKCPPDVVVAHPQEKFVSRLPVSYGIPLTVVQQFGSPKTEIVESWVVAPGMPFHPFPPLPPYPRQQENSSVAAVYSMTINEHKEEGQQQSRGPATCGTVENRPNTAAGNQVGIEIAGVNSQPGFKRMRGSSHDLGRRYFRQHKWRVPPWIRNGLVNMGNNMKGGNVNIDIGNVTNEPRNSYFSQDVSCRGEKSGYSSYQHPKH